MSAGPDTSATDTSPSLRCRSVSGPVASSTTEPLPVPSIVTGPENRPPRMSTESAWRIRSGMDGGSRSTKSPGSPEQVDVTVPPCIDSARSAASWPRQTDTTTRPARSGAGRSVTELAQDRSTNR